MQSKPTPTLAVLNCLAKLGSGFDVVSLGELERVLAAGGDANKIVFSGVGKQAIDIERGLAVNIRCFNVESAEELRMLAEVAKKKQQKARVAIRVNPDVDAKTHPYIATGLHENKFGVDIEAALALYEEMATHPWLELTGIDSHIGSQLTELGPFMDALDRILAMVKILQKKSIPIDHIDLGGGLGVRYQDETPPHPIAYAEAIQHRLENEKHLTVILEPGRAIAANAGVLLTQVLYRKQNSLKKFAIVDAGMNDLLRPALYNAWQEIIPVSLHQGDADLYDVVGPVCETGDFLGKARSLVLQDHDYLAVRGAGAYGFVMSSNYNSRPRAAEIMIDGAQSYLVRERETIASLFYRSIYTMKLTFTKMHGLGNDFMVIDNTAMQQTFDKKLITQLASRQLGVGFDQLLLVEKPANNTVDFNYRIFNADGTEVGQCGNGARCLAEFIYSKGLSTKNPVKVATTQDYLTLTRHPDGLVEAALAYPRFNQAEIPTTLPVVEGKSRMSLYEFDWPCGVVNIGNPHVVFDVADGPAYKSTEFNAIDINAIAAPLQTNGLFPEAVNVGFMKIIARDHIQLRVYERGCGETRACGSGACAAVIVGQLFGKLDTRVRVDLPGGTVTVVWPTLDAPVSLIGTATTVYEGVLDTDNL